MNILYIVVALVVFSLIALMLFRPKVKVLNKSHTRNLKSGKLSIKKGIPKIRKSNGSLVMHPPILEDTL
jgi:hypothetical protein